jgi:L-ribulose-5-phosphate 3-epimerase
MVNRRAFLTRSSGLLARSEMVNRRAFLTRSSGLLASLYLPVRLPAFSVCRGEQPFHISLAEWSLHRSIYSGAIHPLDFPVVARRSYGIDAVEYVNSFFMLSAEFVRELKRRADGEGVRSLLIMVDEEGRLGDPEASLRRDAAERHRVWVDTAKSLGCHSIRVNARSEGSPEEQMRLMADGLRRLAEYAAPNEINILLENHGGLSSNGEWVAGLMRMVDHPRVGTLPDFGNWFQTPWGARPPGGAPAAEYDRYRGVDLMMPFAKGVSAKSYDFDAAGNETSTDFDRMLRIVRKHGFNGHVGVEYEGERLSEKEGILATKRLLERVRERLPAN